MSISIYLSRPGFPTESASVVGNNELEQSWLPIVRLRGMHYLEHAFGAGLSINDENYKGVIGEAARLCDALREQRSYEDDITNPVYRCDRMLRLLNEYPPDSGVEVYIG